MKLRSPKTLKSTLSSQMLTEWSNQFLDKCRPRLLEPVDLKVQQHQLNKAEEEKIKEKDLNLHLSEAITPFLWKHPLLNLRLLQRTRSTYSHLKIPMTRERVKSHFCSWMWIWAQPRLELHCIRNQTQTRLQENSSRKMDWITILLRIWLICSENSYRKHLLTLMKLMKVMITLVRTQALQERFKNYDDDNDD